MTISKLIILTGIASIVSGRPNSMDTINQILNAFTGNQTKDADRSRSGAMSDSAYGSGNPRGTGGYGGSSGAMSGSTYGSGNPRGTGGYGSGDPRGTGGYGGTSGSMTGGAYGSGGRTGFVGRTAVVSGISPPNGFVSIDPKYDGGTGIRPRSTTGNDDGTEVVAVILPPGDNVSIDPKYDGGTGIRPRSTTGNDDGTEVVAVILPPGEFGGRTGHGGGTEVVSGISPPSGNVMITPKYDGGVGTAHDLDLELDKDGLLSLLQKLQSEKVDVEIVYDNQ